MTVEDDMPNNPVNSASRVPELSTSSNQPNCTANEPELAMQSNVSPFFYLNLLDVAATQSSHASSRPGTPTDQLNTKNSDLDEVPPQAEVSCPLVTPTTFVAPEAPSMPVVPTTVAPKDLGPLPPIPDFAFFLPSQTNDPQQATLTQPCSQLNTVLLNPPLSLEVVPQVHAGPLFNVLAGMDEKEANS